MTALAETIREALAPRVPGEHHFRCSSHAGDECDCYAARSNAAFDALERLENALRLADEALREPETSPYAGVAVGCRGCADRRLLHTCGAWNDRDTA